MRCPTIVKSWLLRAYLRLLRWSGRTIVLGPWRSELGFEVLYWIPFLQWALKEAGIPPERCLALSRGGMGMFYPATEQVDLYVLRSVDDVRLQNQFDAERTQKLKQVRVTPWDRAAVKAAVREAKGADWGYLTLHPSWMYWLFDGVWENHDTVRVVERHTTFQALPVPPLPEGVTLPDRFVAVRFYERHTLPLHDAVRGQLVAIVHALASHMPVVLLNQSLFADDHVDLPVNGPNIHVLPTLPPEQNFILQAAVLGRASAFVGTYGGVAQWALRYGKPVISFYVNFSGTAQCHRTLSAMLSASMAVPFEVSMLGAVKLWGMTLTQVLPDDAPAALEAVNA